MRKVLKILWSVTVWMLSIMGLFVVMTMIYAKFFYSDSDNIYMVSRSGNFDKLEELLEEKTPNFIKNKGGSLLDSACRGGQLKIVKFLIENKDVDPHYKNREGKNLLFSVAYSDDKDTNRELVKYLISKGVNINGKSAGKITSGLTPITVAVFGNRIKIVETFIKNGADLQVKDDEGNTLLHHATNRNHIEVAKLLIEKGVDVSMKNRKGETVLDVAIKEEHADMIEFLKKIVDK